MGTLISKKLKDVCIQITDGTHDSPKLQTYGIPFIKGKHISNGYVDFDNCDYITYEEHLKVISRSKPEIGNILFANIGNSIGDMALIKEDVEFSIKNVALIKANTEIVDNIYLYYYMLNDAFQNELKNRKQGSAQPFISLNLLRGHVISYHSSLSTQRKIAGILAAYDHLIENNNKRIKILEEMAQKLYKEWFVDFKFPNHENTKFVESELGLIPEGWAVELVSNILDRKKAGAKYTQNNVLKIGKIPIIDQSTNSVLGYHNNKADHLATPDKPIIIFGDHTCKMKLIIKPFSVGANVIPFIPKDAMPSTFIYYLVNSLVNTKEYKRHWTELVSNKVVIPLKDLQLEYANKISAAIQQINKLQDLSLNLSETRDLLLSRLISGELSVEDLEVKL